MPLCINEKDYNRVLNLLKEELKSVETEMSELKEGNRKKKSVSELQSLQNLQFELQILIHTLVEFVQYDEQHQAVMVNMTAVNKDRLIGFLLTKVQ